MMRVVPDGPERLVTFQDIPKHLRDQMDPFGNVAQFDAFKHGYVGFRRAGEIVAAAVCVTVCSEVLMVLAWALTSGTDRKVLHDLMQKAFFDEKGYSKGLCYIGIRTDNYEVWEQAFRLTNGLVFQSPYRPEPPLVPTLRASILSQFRLPAHRRSDHTVVVSPVTHLPRHEHLADWWKSQIALGPQLFLGTAPGV